MVQLWTPSARGGGFSGDMRRILVSVAAVAVVACCMIAAGGSNDAAVELMGSHHHLKMAMLVEKSARSADTVRLSELSRLAAAADQQATSASALKDLEAGKLKASPGSGVDAETMLANEAKKKSEELVDAGAKFDVELHDLAKKLRKEHHAERQEERGLKNFDHQTRDQTIALHDREMKVLEARHDVQNAAKAGDVAVLRDAQAGLKSAKAIAAGARAEYEDDKKRRDQLRARARLLRKRVHATSHVMQQDRASQLNDRLSARAQLAKSNKIQAHANFLRDGAALEAAHKKYRALAELLGDKNTDHAQVEETLSKIASNIHTWKDLEATDAKDMAKEAKVYTHARARVLAKSVALAGSEKDGGENTSGERPILAFKALLEVRAGEVAGGAWGRPVELQQQGGAFFHYGAPQQGLAMQQGAAPPQGLSPQGGGEYAPAAPMQQGMMPPAMASTMAPPQQMAMPQQQQQQRLEAPPASAQQLQEGAEEGAEKGAGAPVAVPAGLPGAVGDVPYVYNDKQYMPSAAGKDGFPIVWLFADNKTPDPLYFGYQSADGVMHVYNEVLPNSVTRQQAFANEYWTLLATDKKTVAVQPFKISQNNQWLSIANSPTAQ